MKEHPIIFSGPMVRAILEGRKTMTRRVVKPSVKCCTVGAYTTDSGSAKPVNVQEDGDPWTGISCPYGQPGDRLWVRETWRVGAKDRYSWAPGQSPCRLRPSIFMPRWASRITPEVTDVRVERVQDISEEDAKAEGIDEFKIRDQPFPLWQIPKYPPIAYSRVAFASLWDSINAKRGYGWDTNPWVWVIEFKYEK